MIPPVSLPLNGGIGGTRKQAEEERNKLFNIREIVSRLASASAQTDGFGKVHPPIVPEDDPAIVVLHPRLTPNAARITPAGGGTGATRVAAPGGGMKGGGGRNGGGNVNAVLRSGSKGLHGDVYEYFRNDVLNANEFFLNAAGAPRPPV